VSNARSAAGGRSARIGGARKKEREKNERECSGCGTCTTDTKSRFCTTCGQELEMPRVCSGCEEVLLPGDTFCARCGCKSGPQRGGTVSAFEVHAPWKLSPLESKSLLRAGSRHSLRSLSTENLLQEGQGTSRITLNPSGMQMAKTEMNKMILHPSSGPRLIWDMLTMIFVSYDVIVLPLAFLEMETPPAMDGMSWLLRVFWSVDLICAFFTGYHDRDGKLQMSVVKVGKHYLRTWFCMDLGLVLIDWLTVLLKTQAKAASIARLGKTVRAARMLRMARALRLTRVIAEVSPSVEYYLRSEMSVVVLGVTRVMLVMALISHFLACSWYGLGASGGPEAVTWLKVGDYDQLDVGSGYAIALHWSLTQFIGSMEVNPVSTGERMFNVGVLMFAFLALCVLPAKITSLMTQFQITAAERSQALSQLSQFLYDQRVSRYLTLRLVRAANSAMLVQSRKTPEDKIVLLGLISDTLKMELHYEMRPARTAASRPVALLEKQLDRCGPEHLCPQCPTCPQCPGPPPCLPLWPAGLGGFVAGVATTALAALFAGRCRGRREGARPARAVGPSPPLGLADGPASFVPAPALAAAPEPRVPATLPGAAALRGRASHRGAGVLTFG
ncbi:unnamed protein product, partial [Prorocentrum cordatum]